MSDKSMLEKKNTIERFYMDAFCAKSAKTLPNTSGFEISGIVEIDTGDKRGTIFVGSLKKISG